jgi:aldose 1-epimerase
MHTLAADGWEIALVPESGGGLAFARWRGQDILRPCERAAAVADPFELSCFPLVPFSNRIAFGRFVFDGRSVALAPNVAGEPHCMHGQGWRGRWRVESASPSRCAMTYTHHADEWPWDYVAQQIVTCEGDSLILELVLINQDTRPMPAGIGLHPYFARTADCTLRTDLSGMWQRDGSRIAARHVPLPAQLTLSAGMRVDELHLDDCFTGWSRAAWIEWPERGIGLHVTASPLLRFLVLYVPAGRSFFCLEPVSNINDACNTGSDVDCGLVVLEPAATLRGWMRLNVAELG